jgi:FMN phosphatase YigB (HAD superfamily)
MAIEALVLDLGGVIIPLNRGRALAALDALFPGERRQIWTRLEQSGVLERLERGQEDPAEFLSMLAALTGAGPDTLLQAWSAMLDPIPAEHLDLLAQLAATLPLYLLSNTNALHMDWIFEHLDTGHQRPVFGGVFQGIFLSFELGLRKPEPAIYREVRRQIGLPAERLLFIDDLQENLHPAREDGWQVLHHPPNAPLSRSLHPLLQTGQQP